MLAYTYRLPPRGLPFFDGLAFSGSIAIFHFGGNVSHQEIPETDQPQLATSMDENGRNDSVFDLAEIRECNFNKEA